MSNPWGKKDSFRLAKELGVVLEERENGVREAGKEQYVSWLTMYSRLKQRMYYKRAKIERDESMTKIQVVDAILKKQEEWLP